MGIREPLLGSSHGSGTRSSAVPGEKGTTAIVAASKSDPSAATGGGELRSLADLPAVKLHFHPFIGATFCRILNLAEQSIVGTCYCLDHEEGCLALARKAAGGVAVRILLDWGMWEHPSSSRQPDRVTDLLAQGVEFRAVNVRERGRYAILYAKSWGVDGMVYVGGSANFTENSGKSEEHLVVLKDEEVMTDYLTWFEDLWASPRATVVDRGRGKPSRSSRSLTPSRVDS